MQARGRNAQLLMDFESTFGQDPTTPAAIKMPIISSQLRSSQTLTEDRIIRSRRDQAMPSRGNVDVSGGIVIPVDILNIGYWLKAMFGNPVTTGGDLEPYSHEFKPGAIQPSLVFEQGFTDILSFAKFNGCKIGSFSLTFGGDGELTANVDVMGAKETIGETSYDSTPTELSIIKFNNFQASVQEGGSDIATLTEAELQIDFALDGDQYAIGSQGTRLDIPEGTIQISGRIKGFFENTLLLNKAINGTTSSLKFSLTSGTNVLSFLLPEIVYERQSPGIEGPQGVQIELPYRAYYDTAVEGASLIATLTNDQATY